MAVLLSEHLNEFLSEELRKIEKWIKNTTSIECVVRFDENTYHNICVYVSIINNKEDYFILNYDFKISDFADNFIGEFGEEILDFIEGVVDIEIEC